MCLAAFVTACGGGGSSAPAPAPPPAPTVQAVDDPFTLPAGTPSDLAVLVNDSVTGGTATVSVATNPAHGQVTVQGTTLRYAPDAGFYGTDQFSYRVDVGAASSTATVKLTVEAELTLSGSLKPAPTTPTDVIAQVGDRQFKASVDAGGRYLVQIKSARADSLVTLTSQGTAAEARLAMASAVSDFGTLFARNSPRLDDTQWPSLRLDVLTTARYGLLLQTGMPTNGTGLRAALRRQDPDDLFNLVMQLRHLFEENGALPAGMGTTLDYLRSATALAGTPYLWQAGSKVYLSPTADAFAAAEAPTVASTGRRLIIAQRLFSLAPDGQATVQAYDSATVYPGRWTRDGDTLRVKLDGPRPPAGSVIWYPEYRLRSVRGTDDQPSAQLMLDADVDPNCARMSPACVGYTLGWRPYTSFDLERDRLPLRAEDFAASQRWAGLIAEADASTALCLCRAREVSFGAALELPGFTGQLVEGQLLLRAGNLTHRYTRLRQDADGLELWLVELEQNGTRVKAKLIPVVKAADVTLNATSATRRWFAPNLPQQHDPLHWSGNESWWQADGKVISIDHYNGKPYATSTWTLSGDGREVTRLTEDGFIYRYRLVAAPSGSYLALVSPSTYSDGTTYLVRLRDLGPIN
ncbi:Ig-like domain-containing protein [Roseateles sp. BYS87W]|uniref:Ig-like domain-containing protein n=1 Tax=Pelomonas baiyunensis TaxID=3299026 RepID=A0ABW7H206_9BURK